MSDPLTKVVNSKIDIELRVAATQAEYLEVYRLTHRVYAAAGYCDPSPGGTLQHYKHLDEIPETTVLIATTNSLVVGSVSLTLDGPCGLHVDEDFASRMDRIRWECNETKRRLAASWRIVTDPICRSRRAVIKRLIGAVFQLAIDKGVDLLVCDFHPGHERFYRRVVGFHTLGYGECHAVGRQPAVLMAYDLDRDGMPKRWRV